MREQATLLALIIAIAVASSFNADGVVPEDSGMHTMEEASPVEQAILKLQAGQPDKVVTLPMGLLGKEVIGKDLIYDNASMHLGRSYMCWDAGFGKVKCGKRNSKNRLKAVIDRRKSYARAKKHPHSVKFQDMKSRRKETKKKIPKVHKGVVRPKKAKRAPVMYAKVHCRNSACRVKKERLTKAREKNQKMSIREASAKTEMKVAAKAKEAHAKAMELHEKKRVKLTKLAKHKAERLSKAQEKTNKLSAREAMAKKEMKDAMKAKKEHAKAMEVHSKKNKKLRELAKHHLARLLKAQEKSKKLTVREASAKKEVARTFESAKRANRTGKKNL